MKGKDLALSDRDARSRIEPSRASREKIPKL